MEALKILLNVALLFIAVIADVEDLRNCSRISRHLPINIVEPIHYKINLLVKPNQRDLSGTSEITIIVKEATRNISLNSYGIKIEFDHVKITNISKTYDEPGELVAKLMLFRQCFQTQISVIIFDKVIKPGKYIFHIGYKSILSEDIGIEHNAYLWDSTVNSDKWILTNHYIPKAIREIFPCWDDPTVNTTFDISITHPRTYGAFSVTLLAEDRKLPGNMHRTRFNEISKIPTYLLSIIVISKMAYSDMTTRLHYVYQRFDYIHKFLLKKTCEMLGAAASEYNKLMRSFKKEIKVDHIFLSKAVMKVKAHPGVIIYREEDFFYNKTYYYAGRETFMFTLLSHQVGRQWFLGTEVHDDWLFREAISLFYGYLIPSQLF
ncbi:glutamyl aminopeptidase-like [Odontomachus brunneus]|uniref:glutamyl aminopeptidase-like n=1 Tax=Odontomachus brunneus TaxID=486640 RepID=UPI0013F1ACBF|nr:glutamyl aminopeptidase-like [Odontomachus brunneus]